MPTLDQYLAESGRQSELDQLRKTPGGYEKAVQQFSQTGSYGSSPSQPAQSNNFQNTVQQAIEMNRQANQPAVQSLQASLPEISQKFESQRQQTTSQIEPLKQRYSQLLADVKGQGEQQTSAQTRITSGELAKRGIVGSSTLAQQEIQNAVQPIQAQTQSATKSIGLEQEQALQGIQNLLANLTGQETDSQRAVRNAIAQLQSGAAQTGIQQGLTLQQQQQEQAFRDQQAKLAAQQQAIENARAEQLFPIQLKSAQAELNKLLQSNKQAASGVTADEWLKQQFGAQNLYSNVQSGSGSFGKNVADLISQGKYAEANNLLLNP